MPSGRGCELLPGPGPRSRGGRPDLPGPRRRGPLQGPHRRHDRLLSCLCLGRSSAFAEGPVNAPAPTVFIHDDEVFVRLTRTERWQHLLLVVSFTVLLATGLPALFGHDGPAWRGVLHRLAALVLIGDFAWHVLFTVLTER